MKKSLALVPLLLFALTPTTQADEIDDLLEKARASGSQYERIRKIINEEPDQNVRLAAFDLMLNHEDKNMKAIAIDAGLASTDRLLQAKAFQAAVFDLESIHLTLEEENNSKKEKPRYAALYLEKHGNSYVMPIDKKDNEAGTFKGGHTNGEILGTRLNYTDRQWDVKATFTLKDDDAIEGVFEISGYKFLAIGKLR